MPDDEKRDEVFALIMAKMRGAGAPQTDVAITNLHGYVWFVLMDQKEVLCMSPERARDVAASIVVNAQDADEDRLRAGPPPVEQGV